MKTKPLVLLCWVQVVIAALTVFLNLHNQVTRPAAGLEYSRRGGTVLRVLGGGPAEQAGIRAGDRVLTIRGHAVGPEVYPFFFVRAGERVPVVIERDGVQQTLALVPVTQEQIRRGQLRAGGVVAAGAVAAYLNFPLHLWMLGLGVALLVLRPGNKDARLAAMLQVYWAGSMFMFRAYGFGVVLAAMPAILRAPLLIVDAVFAAAFFAVCVHFAMTFPGARRGGWEV
ncbi:MAG TPA: PDZ domain-containing protein, partial [Tepidisphaeraceae bacterium]